MSRQNFFFHYNLTRISVFPPVLFSINNRLIKFITRPLDSRFTKTRQDIPPIDMYRLLIHINQNLLNILLSGYIYMWNIRHTLRLLRKPIIVRYGVYKGDHLGTCVGVDNHGLKYIGLEIRVSLGRREIHGVVYVSIIRLESTSKIASLVY